MRVFAADSLLLKLIGLTICNHLVLCAMRVTLVLNALKGGASAIAVGVLISCFALLPMFFSVAIGRRVDRNPRRPMLLGSCGVLVSALLPLLSSALPVLFLSALLCGLAFSTFSIASQKVTGEIGPVSRRAHNYSLLAVGNSFSVFAGPLVAGFAIDHFGFNTVFLILLFLPAIPIAVLARRKLELPQPQTFSSAPGSAFDLWRLPELRTLLLINVLISGSWDVHAILVPVYGHQIGFSASEIGVVLAAFGIATFAVRLVMPFIIRRFAETQVLKTALIVSGVLYLLFPFLDSVALLSALSFALGCALGSGQPMVLALLHTHAPRGRTGEAVGLRLALLQGSSVTVPVAFGGLGASVGIWPVLWVCATVLIGGHRLVTKFQKIRRKEM
ncbi:MAG: MFS transporter [Burkholderiales bacterium]|jgi:predicted MFS family arabinose efflux permease|nr:MFS transporter [Burkholderiales bacterium]